MKCSQVYMNNIIVSHLLCDPVVSDLSPKLSLNFVKGKRILQREATRSGHINRKQKMTAYKHGASFS